MNIQTRLSRLEAQAPAPATDGDLTGWLLGVVAAVYESADEADQARRVASLGPQPEPATAAEAAMLRCLSVSYGAP